MASEETVKVKETIFANFFASFYISNESLLLKAEIRELLLALGFTVYDRKRMLSSDIENEKGAKLLVNYFAKHNALTIQTFEGGEYSALFIQYTVEKIEEVKFLIFKNQLILKSFPLHQL